MDNSLCNIIPLRNIEQLVDQWLQEDTPSVDFGGFVVGEKQETAFLFCKSPGVLCGIPFVNQIFKKLNCVIEWKFSEGDFINPETKTIVAEVKGRAFEILLGERVALNCMSRCSGIATLARQLNHIKENKRWHGEIAGTRKTTPGFRLPEKYSLLVGSCSMHRYDLSSLVMLKDNHIWSTGSISKAVVKARSVCGFSLKIEVECQSLSDAYEAATAGADIVMLDNLQPGPLQEAARLFKAKHPNVTVEASGGITKDNIGDYMGEAIDVISLGSLTQGHPVVDLSLKIQPKK